MKRINNSEIVKYITGGRMPDIEQVRANCLNQTAVERKKQTKRLKPILIIATMFTLVFMLSAFIYKVVEREHSWQVGTVLETLTFGNFEINKVDEIKFREDFEYLDSSTNVGTIRHYKIEDREVYERTQLSGDYREKVSFESIEEAVETGGEHLAFTPKGLNYIPQGYVFDFLSTIKDEKGDYSTYYFIRYKGDDTGDKWITLSETYVGEPFTLHVDTKCDIEKVTFNNGIEALLEINDAEFAIYNEYQYTLTWIKNGVMYSLDGLDLPKDEIIKIAESVE